MEFKKLKECVIEKLRGAVTHLTDTIFDDTVYTTQKVLQEQNQVELGVMPNAKQCNEIKKALIACCYMAKNKGNYNEDKAIEEYLGRQKEQWSVALTMNYTHPIVNCCFARIIKILAGET